MIFLIHLVVLILLGLLGIASWLKGRQPNLGGQIGQLESIGGWVGLVGLVWGIVMLLQTLQMMGYIGLAPGAVLISLVSSLIVIALSLILALPILRKLFGANDFTNKLGDLAGKLGAYKIGLGFACLVLALYSLLSLAGLRL